MAASTPTSFQRTRPTIIRFPGCLLSAICTMFGVFGGSRKFSPMYQLMARHADSHPIIKVDYQVGIFGNWFDMMGVESASPRTAFLTSVVISTINCMAPLGKITLSLGAFANKTRTAFPMRGFITNEVYGAPRITTETGTESGALLFAVERFSACKTLSRLWRIAMRPTRAGTVFRFIGSISLYFIRLIAHYTSISLLSIFHVINYNIFSENYCAVILQRMKDAFPDIAIERI